MMYLKLLEKQEQTKPQSSRWRKIIKIRAKINEKTKQNYTPCTSINSNIWWNIDSLFNKCCWEKWLAAYHPVLVSTQNG
jgi:hypothetical protein